MTRDEALAGFATQWTGTPRVFRAPGRINVIGEHTDYCGGFVMPAAIDRWCWVAVAANGTDRLRLVAQDLDQSADLDLGDLIPRGDWTDYVAGVAKVLQDEGIKLPGADLWISSEVPIGAGVSSSAALEVASLLALLSLTGTTASPMQVALWAQAAENRFVGMPCGIMDQFASANGIEGSALILDCRSLEVQPASLPEDAVFLLVNSMAPHVLADGEYRARRADCEAAAATLRVESLRDVVDLDQALSRLSGGPALRCRHVVSENARVADAAEAMARGDLVQLGALMTQSHASLRDNMQVSVPLVDQLAEIARQTPGVFGARMMGGGFGGSVIALVDRALAAEVQASIVAEYGKVLGRVPDAFVCRAVAGAGEVMS
jgi:galactokinase